MKLNDKAQIETMIAAKLRERGLEGILNLNEISQDVLQQIEEHSTTEDVSTSVVEKKETITELENPAVASGPTEFPKKENDEEEESILPPEGFKTTDKIVPGEKVDFPTPTDNTNQIRNAVMPQFLQDVEPGKVIIFDENELSEGGENLSKKPFKTYDDPNTEESIIQMWSEKGITKVEVFRAKFERIGDLEYDYRNGTTKFVRINEQPLHDANGVYKENPYKVEPNPVMVDDATLESHIKNNYDIDQKVNDVISNIVKDHFMTNSEKAQIPEENIELNETAITLNDVVKVNSEFIKIDTPKHLLEAIEHGDESSFASKNLDVKKYIFEDKEYIFLTNALSKRKCYVK